MSDNGNNNHSNQNNTQQATQAKKELKSGDIKNAFFQSKSGNVADYLVVPGDDLPGLFMRTILDRTTDGTILGVAFAAELGAISEFKYETGREGVLLNIASRVSDRGEARRQLVSAIIGDKEMKARKGFFNKLKENLYGNDNEK